MRTTVSLVEQIGVLIITYNEALNIERTLDKLTWAKRILIIDSGSTDGTVEIVSQRTKVEVLHRPFDDFAGQCNFGLSRIATNWVLSLDADYELSDALVTEVTSLTPADDVGGYKARFIYRIYGRPLRGALYPERIVLYRREGATYRNEGHGHRVTVGGRVLQFTNPIFHDDRKPLARWFISQQRYAKIEAEYLLSSESIDLKRVDRIRRLGCPAPFAALFYTLVVKGCMLDGWAGWFYALQRMLAEIMIALEITNKRLHRTESKRP
jgi:glycosyltransferase involved in cell wall biosynthesis